MLQRENDTNHVHTVVVLSRKADRVQAGGRCFTKVSLPWYHVLSLFELLGNNLFLCYHNMAPCTSFASLCKIFTFLPNYMGMHIDSLGAKHLRVRNKFSKHLCVRNNYFALRTCCMACNKWYASPV